MRPMNSRRLYAVVLLVAVAIFQARVALAACVNVDAPSHAGAVCCAVDPAQSALEAATERPLLCGTHCLKSRGVSDADPNELLAAKLTVPAARPAAGLTLRVDRSYLPLSLSAAHPPHTRLIYVLQRLLI
jgi:hypothetical protein